MQHVQTIASTTKVADVAAAGSIGAAAAANLSAVNLYVQIAAGLVAILAGLAAAAFHMYKTALLHKHRHDSNQ